MASEEAYKEALAAEFEKAKTLLYDVDVSKCVISIKLKPQEQVAKAEKRFAEIDDFVDRSNKQSKEG